MPKWFSENMQSIAPYGDYLTVGEVRSALDIGSDCGAIVREGMGKVAVYRDSQGSPHMFSATCPHLGGLVRWNSSEKTWDCPCHGSRFSALDGSVITGPANQGLKAVDEIKEELPLEDTAQSRLKRPTGRGFAQAGRR